MSIFDRYPKTDKFRVLGSIVLPHKYIVGIAKELFNKDMVGLELTNKEKETFIINFEKKHGPSCCAKGCNLAFEEHILTLVIEAMDITPRPELHAYMASCEPYMKEDGITGFSFMPKQEENTNV